MNDANKNHLWVWNESLKWCVTRYITQILKWVIEAANPGKLPKSQVVHHVATTLAFLQTHSIDEMQQAGQWSSSTSFAERNLALNVLDAPCMTMGTVLGRVNIPHLLHPHHLEGS